jgi:predicted metal-dependent hydrolase
VPPLKYLAGYPEDLQREIWEAIRQGHLAIMLRKKYPGTHEVRSGEALYEYTLALKSRFLRSAESPAKVAFDNRLHVTANAFGLNGQIPRVQGNRVKANARSGSPACSRRYRPSFCA